MVPPNSLIQQTLQSILLLASSVEGPADTLSQRSADPELVEWSLPLCLPASLPPHPQQNTSSPAAPAAGRLSKGNVDLLLFPRLVSPLERRSRGLALRRQVACVKPLRSAGHRPGSGVLRPGSLSLSHACQAAPCAAQTLSERSEDPERSRGERSRRVKSQQREDPEPSRRERSRGERSPGVMPKLSNTRAPT